MSPTRLTAITIAATALIASGCGSSKSSTSASSNSSSTPTTPTTTAATTPATTVPAPTVASGKPLSHKEWISRGDAICARLNKWLAANTIKTEQEFDRVVTQAAVKERAELAALVKLVPPRDKAADWQSFLQETQQWAEDSTKLGEVAKAGGPVFNSKLLAAGRDTHERLARLAARDGFKECSLI